MRTQKENRKTYVQHEKQDTKTTKGYQKTKTIQEHNLTYNMYMHVYIHPLPPQLEIRQ